VLRDTNEQGRFDKVKTRLTTKREEEKEGGEIIVHVVVPLVVSATQLDPLTDSSRTKVKENLLL